MAAVDELPCSRFRNLSIPSASIRPDARRVVQQEVPWSARGVIGVSYLAYRRTLVERRLLRIRARGADATCAAATAAASHPFGQPLARPAARAAVAAATHATAHSAG